MSDLRILCKGLAISEPQPTSSSNDSQSTTPNTLKSEEVPSSGPIFNRKLLLDKAKPQLYVQIKRFDQADTKTGLIPRIHSRGKRPSHNGPCPSICG